MYLVVGLGETGAAVLDWCARQNWSVRVTDTRDQLPQLEGLQQKYPQFDWKVGSQFCSVQGDLQVELLDGVTEIVVSPGLSLHHSPIKTLLQHAQQRNIRVIGELELFAQALLVAKNQENYTPKVIVITGTNGKTTVTALTTHLIEKAGKRVVKAGNISPSVLTAWMDACAQPQLPEVWVLELSSFQLATTHSLPVDVGVILNVTEDHLDWHLDMEDYLQAKLRLLRMSQAVVLPRNDPTLMSTVASLLTLPHVRTFGGDAPVLEQDIGMVNVQGLRWLKVAYPVESVSKKTSKKAVVEPEMRKEGQPKQLMPTPALPLKGTHNMLNTMASFLACRLLDISWNHLLRDVLEYHGEPHRVEFVRSVRGVDFYDDSKGTNVGATLAAVSGLERPVHLILGGDGKGQDFSPLLEAVEQYARGVYIIGKDQALIAQVFQSSRVPVACFSTLEAAVTAGYERAQEGDIVLLSPACASWDMFRNYAHRAECFIRKVEELALDAGEVL